MHAPAAAGKGSPSPCASGIAVEEPALAEHESLKFLSYARRQASSAVAIGKGGLIFNDIVPIETTAPPVAAQALYHLLGLATKGMVHVNQPIAYGEVSRIANIRRRHHPKLIAVPLACRSR